ncbi:hypothetical protein HU200_028889 [Digitaria exilis]|uniref:Uncharacterized protein n=1 Tax=Digitaria exilis TaxID=1010633 RepID=A0A835ETH6_9POAL|nr:hypothetical protein HU200_028889 [Digitaria exilis]
MQLQEDHHVQGNRMLKMIVLKKDWSRVQNKKKVVKQVYVVKKDGYKDESSYLNSVSEEPINVPGTSASDGKGEEKVAIDPPSAKSEQKKVKKPKGKNEVLLSKTETKLGRSLHLSNCQRKNLQKLSAQELRKKGMAWVLKRRICTQDKDDVQAKGATPLKEKSRSERQSSNTRFAPNHRNCWSLHHPFDFQMSYMPMSWNSSYGMHGYPSCCYFDPWLPYWTIYHGGFIEFSYT